ncbi:hypothetical protein OG802_00295 [Streptomyces sp. NBC_00704]|uniref:hypothetical protein n=1 Tax=Streptomyces sp. NBC_00704 TaxID=2975809 RepID=UPI002E367A4D|nr:hypothetical protein [Streptomyces sp. NBC_00704]
MAVVAVLGIVAGFFGLPATGLRSPTSAAQPTVTVTATVTAASDEPQQDKGADQGHPAPPASSDATTAVFYHGTVRLQGYSELDSNPPSQAEAVGGDISLSATLSDGTARFANVTMVLVKADQKPPTQSECANLVHTEGQDVVKVTVGTGEKIE